MTHRLFLLSVALFGLLALPAQAQEVTTKSAANEKATVLRKKAIKLLESVAEQVGSLQSPENRARIASNVANLLWDHDEKRSRELLTSVEQDIRQWYSEIDDEGVEGMEDLSIIGKLRSDIVGRMAKHDLKLALGFLRSTRPAPKVNVEEKLNRAQRDYGLYFDMAEVEAMLEVQLVQQAAAIDPQVALQMGREMLTRDLSPNLVPVLEGLQRKDKDVAATFYKAIVDQLRETKLSPGSTATSLSLQLAQSFRPPAVDEQVYRELLGMILTAAITSGCGNSDNEHRGEICYRIGFLWPALQKYYPARVAPLKRWAVSDEELQAREVWGRMQDVIDDGTVDETLEFAAQHPAFDEYIRSAALSKARRAGDLTKAQQIADANPNPGSRRRMLDELEGRQRWVSIRAQRSAEFQQALSEMPTDEYRLGALLEVAQEIAESDRKGALSLLEQAGQIIYRSKSPKLQIFGQAELALTYCSLKSDRGFPILEALIPRLNELVAASAALDGLEIRYLRNGEWNMTGNGMVGGLLSKLALNAEYFASIDFDRSVTLTTQLQRPELRLMAQEKIAQGILAPGNYMKLSPADSFEYFRSH